MPEKTSVRSWPLKRTIFVSGPIKAISATLLAGALARLPKEGRRKPLFLIIDSSGGDFYAVLKMRGFLRKYERSLVTVAYRRAYSGGLTLFELGAKRLMTAKSVLRFHQANHNFRKAETMNAAQMSVLADHLRTIDAMQKLIYIERAGLLPTPLFKRLNHFFDEEAYLRYSHAKNVHMADEMIPEPESLESLIDYLQLHKTTIFLD